MIDIVERLHRGVNTNAPPDETDRLMAEAADKIERLRALLQRWYVWGGYEESDLAEETRAALEGKP